MGSSNSISQTVLGQSLINKTFQTKVPFRYYYYKSDNRYYMKQSDDNDNIVTIFGNTDDSESFSMVIKEPIEFTITDVMYRWSIDAGKSIYIIVNINKYIPLSHILNVKETRMGQDINININETTSPKIIRTNNHLIINEQITLSIYGYNKTGFIMFPNHDYNINQTADYDSNILTYINC